jgi:hypothetical protein
MKILRCWQMIVFFVDKSDIIEKKADASIQRTGISASQSRAALERHPY